tara:strand:- start:311 stop:1663 length:1353 start_codon:yes stop_codon:yes gene_type:complete
MAKLLKLRRGSTSGHGSFTGAEGEVTVDTDKDTLVVHDGSTAGGHPVAAEDMANVSGTAILGRIGTGTIGTHKLAAGGLPANVTVETANITDLTIANADVSASAAIAGTKISPDFGSQNIATTGTAATGALTVTGNIAVSGTVDGVDVAALNTTVGNLGVSGGAIASGTTATTQAASDNSTKVATTAYTTTAISNLVDSSPSTLNTLNELAAALGDDANFSTTVTNSIATKLPLAGGTITGDVTIASGTTNKNVNIDVDSKIRFDDNLKATFGNSDDVEIYHTGSHSYIHNTTGDLNIRSDVLRLRATNDEQYIACAKDGQVELYHDNNKKLETSSTGVSVTGALVASGDVTAFSDSRLKTEIHTIKDPLEKVGRLRGVTFKWLHTDKPSSGVIAQEVQEVFPELVVPVDHEGKEVLSVDYGKLVGVLIESVKALKAELDQHKADCAGGA